MKYVKLRYRNMGGSLLSKCFIQEIHFFCYSQVTRLSLFSVFLKNFQIPFKRNKN